MTEQTIDELDFLARSDFITAFVNTGVVSALLLSGCTNSPALQGKIEGDWKRGSTQFTFRDGLIVIMPAGVVYGTYEVIDENNIRVKIDYADTNLDLLVIVEFSNPDKMDWYINSGERKWWTLSRLPQ